MKYTTHIDTVGIMIKDESEDVRDTILDQLLSLLETKKLYISYPKEPYENTNLSYTKSYIVFYQRTKIVTIIVGSYPIMFSIVGKRKGDASISSRSYYLSITVAGLKSYDTKIDTLRLDTLLDICTYCNTYKISFDIKQLDIALDMDTKLENILSLCTKRIPKRNYYQANEEQKYPTTRYIEKDKSNVIGTQKAVQYDKAKKENNVTIGEVTRFEVSLKSRFFRHRQMITGAIEKALNRYDILYIPQKRKQQALRDAYDSFSVLRKRELNKLNLDEYERCFFDIATIRKFINILFTVEQKFEPIVSNHSFIIPNTTHINATLYEDLFNPKHEKKHSEGNDDWFGFDL